MESAMAPAGTATRAATPAGARHLCSPAGVLTAVSHRVMSHSPRASCLGCGTLMGLSAPGVPWCSRRARRGAPTLVACASLDCVLDDAYRRRSCALPFVSEPAGGNTVPRHVGPAGQK